MVSIIDKKYSLEENLINCKIFLIKEEKILKAAFALSNGTTLKYSINNESNTFYTGDFHITVKQTDSVNKTVFEQSSITFSLPGE